MKQANTAIILFFILLFQTSLFAQYSDSTILTLKATYYADRFVGRKTSNGEIFSHDKLTAAHKTIKLGTFVEVTNPNNGKSVVVKVNDRCPITGILDMTRRGLNELGIKGTGAVSVKILGKDYKPAEEKNTTNFDEQYASTKKTKTTKGKNKKKHTQSNQEHNTSTTDTTANNSKPIVPVHHNKYCIELNTVRNEETAQQEISLLPSTYQDKITLQHKGKNIQIILDVDMSQNQMEILLDELKTSFPRAIIIKN